MSLPRAKLNKAPDEITKTAWLCQWLRTIKGLIQESEKKIKQYNRYKKEDTGNLDVDRVNEYIEIQKSFIAQTYASYLEIKLTLSEYSNMPIWVEVEKFVKSTKRLLKLEV